MLGGAAPGTDDDEQEGAKHDAPMAKVTNDSVALIRNLATKRGRNADWAEDAVRESVVATADEALEIGVIDLIAKNTSDLLSQADGLTVATASGERTLQTAGATVIELATNWREQLLMHQQSSCDRVQRDIMYFL